MTVAVRRSFVVLVVGVAVIASALAIASPVAASGAPPVATWDFYAGRLHQPLAVAAPGVLANDTDPEHDPLTARLAYGQPYYGTVDLRPDGSFLYQPAANNYGYDSFAYQAFDGTSWSSPQWVYLTLYGDPAAFPDRYGLLAARTLHVPAEEGVLANDYGQPELRARLESGPRFGRLALSKDGSFDYTPPRGFVGDDSFEYRARDGAGVLSKPTTVNVRVARTNHAPIAVADTYRFLEDTTFVAPAPGLLKNDEDKDGNSLRVEVVDYPAEGSLDVHDDGSFSFQTAHNQDNDAFFTYRVTDDFEWSETVTVYLDVIAVNDPPIAESDYYELMQDTVFVEGAPGVLANDHDDVEFDEPIVWELTVKPDHGKLELDASGGFVYEPDEGYSGPDSFEYRVGDSGGPGGTATVSLTIDPT